MKFSYLLEDHGAQGHGQAKTDRKLNSARARHVGGQHVSVVSFGFEKKRCGAAEGDCWGIRGGALEERLLMVLEKISSLHVYLESNDQKIIIKAHENGKRLK